MGPRPYRGENPAPLIRPSVRTGVPSPKEEGVGSAQIGRNLPYCGTFRYIYWELWRSAPVGGGRPSVPPLRQKRGKPGRRAESSRPTKGVAGTCPLIRPIRGHLSLSPLSLRDIIPTHFGLRPFPPDRGNRPLDKGSRPPRGRLLGGFGPLTKKGSRKAGQRRGGEIPRTLYLLWLKPPQSGFNKEGSTHETNQMRKRRNLQT